MNRVLVANRGEIAVRIIRAVHDLGLEAVAVHSEPDAKAPHVRMADQAISIGAAPAARSYLDIDAILQAARASGADAVHPGYGFLAERADFAEAVQSAGIRFIGPDARHIELMGDKARARDTANHCGVPTIPGSEGAVGDADEAVAVARLLGFPVALKAAGGGGGRGIRIVREPQSLRQDYQTASQEAARAFGDPRVYVERFLPSARHVEVQVLGDGERWIHLHERECSLQRRRQKLIEETPAPLLSESARDGLHRAALDLCRAIGYRSAGTIEFLVDADTEEFFFMEMNTRIQVEHTVTEVVTGVDLIAEQLRIAAGEPLRLLQRDVDVRGCALQVRINAEDPANGFIPSPGSLGQVALPAGPWVRMDTWIEPYGEVVPYYDSLLGKVIVWGPDRPTTLARARRALRELEVAGVETTKAVIAELIELDWFIAADFDTSTLEAWLEEAQTGGAA